MMHKRFGLSVNRGEKNVGSFRESVPIRKSRASKSVGKVDGPIRQTEAHKMRKKVEKSSLKPVLPTAIDISPPRLDRHAPLVKLLIRVHRVLEY